MTNKHEENHECCNHSDEDCGCGCGCDHDHEEPGIIYLTLEDGSEMECNVLGIFEVEDKAYIALVPMGEEEVLLYEYIEVEDGIELGQIESDEEFELVSEAFYTLFVEEEDIEDLEEE
ncbi:MAG: DUF1292 domain-containing protein [Clostridiaceae bacterium]|nr:DUF1292 domain-containing protein [Clostridiaceae bacterium]MBW4860739.1 DUF1292 domain-containing protein [Clostridiaceae bacterium]MBW4869007.1 DUF1292 domain-containing protein [Clostridiaceae bacterium]